MTQKFRVGEKVRCSWAIAERHGIPCGTVGEIWNFWGGDRRNFYSVNFMWEKNGQQLEMSLGLYDDELSRESGLERAIKKCSR